MYRDKAHYGNKWDKFENFGFFFNILNDRETLRKRNNTLKMCVKQGMKRASKHPSNSTFIKGFQSKI